MPGSTAWLAALLAVEFLITPSLSCLPRTTLPLVALPTNYPSVTTMEVRALGVLMGGILETKAMNMVSTGFISGALLTDVHRPECKSELEAPHAIFRPPPLARRGSTTIPYLLDQSAAISYMDARTIRGGGARAREQANLRASANPSEEIQAVDVNTEPLYPPITASDKRWAVVVGLVAGACKLAWSKTTAGGVLGGSAAMIAAAWACMFVRRDQRMLASLVTEEEARYPESHFITAGSVRAHYLEATPSGGGAVRGTVVLVHGFGASARSYHACLQPLADAAHVRVLSVDMPGFGLTSRPRTLKHYDAAAMITALTAALHLKRHGPVVVVGHSLGGLATARHLLSTPDRPTAAILVAPAILSAGKMRRSEPGNASAPRPADNLKPLIWAGAVCGVMLRLSATSLTLALVLLLRALTPLLAVILRLAVYTKAFWSAGLSAAYYDRAKLTETTLEGYRRGSWVRGWEAGVLNFVLFRATAGKGPARLLREAAQAGGEGGEGAGGLVARLKASGVPLLLVHGAQDRIIPLSNSRALSGVTEAPLECIEECGHCPMEERPGEFVRIVSEFVDQVCRGAAKS